MSPFYYVDASGFLKAFRTGVVGPQWNLNANRFDPYGDDMPEPGETVGVIPGVARTTHSGNLVLNNTLSGTSGNPTVIENLDVTGKILWNGNDAGSYILLRNIRVLGGPSGKSVANGDTGNVPLIQCWTTVGTGLVMEDIEIAPSHPDEYIYGIHGHGYVLRRFDIHDCTDGIVTFTNRGSLREGGSVYDIRWWQYDPNQASSSDSSTHADPHQAEGGTGHVSIGVHYDNGPINPNSKTHGVAGAVGYSVLGTQNNGVHTDFELDHCWITGTTNRSHIQWRDSNKGPWINPKITNTRFTGSYGGGGHGWVRVSDQTKENLTFTGNTANGSPITLSNVIGTSDLRGN